MCTEAGHGSVNKGRACECAQRQGIEVWTKAGCMCVHTGRARTWNVEVHSPQCRRPMQDINRSHWEALNSSREKVCAQQFPHVGGWGWMQEWVGEKILSQRHPLASSGVWRRTGSTTTIELCSMAR